MSGPGRRVLLGGLFAVSCLLLLASPALAQCSMCSQVVSQSPEAQRAGAQLNQAILIMFVAPYLIFSTFAIVLFRAPLARQAQRLLRIFFLPR